MAVQKFPKTNIFLVLLIIVNNSQTRKTSRVHTIRKEPEIWLSAYTQVDAFQNIKADWQFRSKKVFQNDFAAKNGTDFVFYDETLFFDFTCEATYPIMWKFPHTQQLKSLYQYNVALRNFRTSRFSSVHLQPENIKFKSIITITRENIDFLSVNLTCSSINLKPETQSSVYIYLNGKSMIENQGKTLQISLNLSEELGHPMSPLVLPCRPGSPDLTIVLSKETDAIAASPTTEKNQTRLVKKWEQLEVVGGEYDHIFYYFDPKVGFIFEMAFVTDHIYGLYKCTVKSAMDDTKENIETDKFVMINVTKETKKSDNGNSISDTADNELEVKLENIATKSILYGNAKVGLEYSLDNLGFTDKKKITCCSGVKNQQPFIIVEACSDPLQCILTQKAAEKDFSGSFKYYVTNTVKGTKNDSSDCVNHPLNFGGSTTIVTCRGQNVDYLDLIVEMFHPLVVGPVANRSKRIEEAELKENENFRNFRNITKLSSLTQYVTLATSRTAATTQKMILLIGKNSPRMPDLSEENNSTLNAAVYFVNEAEPTFEDDFGYEGSLNRQNPKDIMEYGRDVYYDGEQMIFVCIGVKFFYAHGFHLRVNWRNGTKTVIVKGDDSEGSATTRPVKAAHFLRLYGSGDMFDGSSFPTTSIFGKAIQAREGMTSVDCWMPQLNSGDWDKISKPLNIQPGVAPCFKEEKEETVYFCLGDVEKSIFCTVVEGLPLPVVTVLKDGSLIHVNNLNYSYHSSEKFPHKLYNASSWIESMENNRRQITVKIEFATISIELQGVYRCLAKNVNRTTIRTIQIFVIEKHSVAVWVPLVIVGTLCIVVIGLGLKYRNIKLTILSLRGRIR